MSSFVKVSEQASPLSADPGEEFPFLHTITVVDRVVSVDKPELVQNNIKTETVTLNLDSEWEGLSTVINIGNDKPTALLWNGSPVVIPAELMTNVGSLDVSVVGYNDGGNVRAVTKEAKGMFNVVASGYVNNNDIEIDPTTLVGQLVEAANKANQAADRFNQASADIEGIGPAIEKVQTAETNAKQSETNAATSASNASQSASNASTSEKAAKTSETNAAGFATSASGYATSAQSSATNASEYATSASQSKAAAKASETAASEYAQTASNARDAASQSADNAAASATAAQDAVDNFGLEAGTTTTGEPGTDAEVEIVKDGTKYKANFTIPRGADGTGGSGGGSGIASVVTDSTLTGNGTSGNPLGMVRGTMNFPIMVTETENTNYWNMTTAAESSDGCFAYGGMKCGQLFDAPNEVMSLGSGSIFYGLLINSNGANTINRNTATQLLFSRPTNAFYFRARLVGGVWNAWQKLVTSNALDSYTPLTTTTALDTRVKALEAKPSGGLASVTHDSTLLGDGTSSNPLKLAKGTILTLNAVDKNADDGSTFDLNDALEGFTRVVGLKKNLVNLPNLDYIAGDYATGLVLTTTVGSGNKIQLWFDAKTNKGKIHIRAYVQPNWSVWNTTSMESALSNYVPLSTYQALEARVQALEAKLANQ